MVHLSINITWYFLFGSIAIYFMVVIQKDIIGRDERLYGRPLWRDVIWTILVFGSAIFPSLATIAICSYFRVTDWISAALMVPILALAVCVDYVNRLAREKAEAQWRLNAAKFEAAAILGTLPVGEYYLGYGRSITVEEERRRWFRRGALHREDGPAVEWKRGDFEWYREGKRHREDGPAVEGIFGYREWWINGKYVNREQK
jgi:hypothetical protein